MGSFVKGHSLRWEETRHRPLPVILDVLQLLCAQIQLQMLQPLGSRPITLDELLLDGDLLARSHFSFASCPRTHQKRAPVAEVLC